MPSHTSFKDSYATGDPDEYSSLVGYMHISLDQHNVPILAYSEVYWEEDAQERVYAKADFDSAAEFYDMVDQQRKSASCYDIEVEDDDDEYRVRVYNISYANVSHDVIQSGDKTNFLARQIDKGMCTRYDLRLLALADNLNDAKVKAL